MIDFKKIKLIIWDLDDTFWDGTLSEGEITPIKHNCDLVKNLTLRGIVNTVCSKNDFNPAMDKLQEIGMKEYFVFSSIDWTPKGNRIAKMIKEMGLRPINCLFIDDNVVNLNEARFYSPDIMVAEPTIIQDLIDYVRTVEVSDIAMNRLRQYQVLEMKQRAKEEANDNMAFLYSSNTQVILHDDCEAVADRLYEMIHRTNQLNFTKNRSSRDEFDNLLADSEVKCGYVTVKDNFGDYGIVGFYAIKHNKCIHFLFSCRTIGQGVEQWVYSTLGCPELVTVEPVVNHLNRQLPPEWINKSNNKCKIKEEKLYDGKIVFKGPCDLEIMSSYLKASNLVREFTYVGLKQVSVEHQNHSQNYLTFPFLSEFEKDELLNECIFNDRDMFATKMYDKDTVLVFISTLIEGNLGIYRRKKDGFLLAYGEWAYPLTDEKIWPLYCENKIYTGGNHFTKEFLVNFKENFEFVGRLSPDNVLSNIKKLIERLPSTTCVCLMLGSEMPYEKNDSLSYEKREEYHKKLNNMLREFANNNPRIYLIDFNEFIHSQADFTDNINHFHRRIYFEAAKMANKIIEQVTGKSVREQNRVVLLCIEFKRYAYSKLGQIKFLRKFVRYVKAKFIYQN